MPVSVSSFYIMGKLVVSRLKAAVLLPIECYRSSGLGCVLSPSGESGGVLPAARLRPLRYRQECRLLGRGGVLQPGRQRRILPFNAIGAASLSAAPFGNSSGSRLEMVDFIRAAVCVIKLDGGETTSARWTAECRDELRRAPARKRQLITAGRRRIYGTVQRRLPSDEGWPPSVGVNAAREGAAREGSALAVPCPVCPPAQLL